MKGIPIFKKRFRAIFFGETKPFHFVTVGAPAIWRNEPVENRPGFDPGVEADVTGGEVARAFLAA